jgi:para-nitrobenzyl esterase
VWIHGGAFIMGAGSQPLYDGTSFAANHDVVVVTINYRLGLFGLMFLGDVYGDEYANGNVCLLDQVAALAWVRDNIAGFGGDPSAVTVMGESAGAVAISHLLAMPAARGLFHRAILQSGAPGLITRTREEATTFARDVIASLAGEDPRTVAADRLVQAQQQATLTRGLGAFAPYVDGVTLPHAPLDLVRRGSAANIPMLLGSNKDEWALFDVFFGEAGTQILVAQVRDRLPEADVLHALYVEARSDRDPRRAWVDMLGDLAFRIPMIKLAEANEAHAPMWMYRFDYATQLFDGRLGAAHALELPFVWNVVDSAFAQILLGGDVAAAKPLATEMHGTWAAFIRGVDPAWPRYDTKTRTTMIYDRTSKLVDDPSGVQRAAWP